MSAEFSAIAAPSSPLRFGPDGLIPVVIQDVDSHDVLMVAFMNEEALAATRATGRCHYWSRSRGRLWRKGETSGHDQIVEAIYLNCEENSLLIVVRQIGAVCHDGYPTCYYRRLETDDTLSVIRAQAFEPAAVYGATGEVDAANDGEAGRGGESGTENTTGNLTTATRAVYGAYTFLREHDMTGVSATSERLRSTEDQIAHRVAGELRELAGVLDGSHRHADSRSDLLLEGTQVLYWLFLSALRARIPWEELRPDLALATDDPSLDAALAARLVRAEADRWDGGPSAVLATAVRCHAALALLAQATSSGGVRAAEVVMRDLDALREKPYLAPYFASRRAEE